jgi:hypothetical protein
MTDRFTFEQQIMNCWNVVDDIKSLNKQYSEHSMTRDEVENYLLGLETIYQVKFEQMFATFEQLIKEKHIV